MSYIYFSSTFPSFPSTSHRYEIPRDGNVFTIMPELVEERYGLSADQPCNSQVPTLHVDARYTNGRMNPCLPVPSFSFFPPSTGNYAPVNRKPR